MRKRVLWLLGALLLSISDGRHAPSFTAEWATIALQAPVVMAFQKTPDQRRRRAEAQTWVAHVRDPFRPSPMRMPHGEDPEREELLLEIGFVEDDVKSIPVPTSASSVESLNQIARALKKAEMRLGLIAKRAQAWVGTTKITPSRAVPQPQSPTQTAHRPAKASKTFRFKNARNANDDHALGRLQEIGMAKEVLDQANWHAWPHPVDLDATIERLQKGLSDYEWYIHNKWALFRFHPNTVGPAIDILRHTEGKDAPIQVKSNDVSKLISALLREKISPQVLLEWVEKSPIVPGTIEELISQYTAAPHKTGPVVRRVKNKPAAAAEKSDPSLANAIFDPLALEAFRDASPTIQEVIRAVHATQPLKTKTSAEKAILRMSQLEQLGMSPATLTESSKVFLILFSNTDHLERAQYFKTRILDFDAYIQNHWLLMQFSEETVEYCIDRLTAYFPGEGPQIPADVFERLAMLGKEKRRTLGTDGMKALIARVEASRYHGAASFPGDSASFEKQLLLELEGISNQFDKDKIYADLNPSRALQSYSKALERLKKMVDTIAKLPDDRQKAVKQMEAQLRIAIENESEHVRTRRVRETENVDMVLKSWGVNTDKAQIIRMLRYLVSDAPDLLKTFGRPFMAALTPLVGAPMDVPVQLFLYAQGETGASWRAAAKTAVSKAIVEWMLKSFPEPKALPERAVTQST